MSTNMRIAFYKEQLEKFITHKRIQGYKYLTTERNLNRFIKFLSNYELNEDGLSKELIEAYICRHTDETSKNQSNRICEVRQFLIFLNLRGHKAYIPRNPNKKGWRSQSFVPYIFTHKEIAKIFRAADSIKPHSRYNCAIVYPVLFRMLYGCGLRISEALNLCVCDVDLINGVLTIKKSKFGKDRLVPMSESLNSQCKTLYTQIHGNSTENDYFFKNKDGERRSERTVYWRFRELLWESSIPYLGKGKGPRLHDLRHVFCCHSLKEMSDAGIDLYCALPVLSTYVGHSSITSTEKYLRLTAEFYPDVIKRVERTTSFVYPEVYKVETY